MTVVSLYEGDNRISLSAMIARGEQVDSVVTDAPYGLVNIVKRMGSKDAAPVKHGTDGAFARLSKGFMGQTWDGSGIERDPEFWKLVLGVLKPGGYCFAFSGARTGHWQAVAMEQAGFIMHPMHGWVYGSGMPKAHSAREAGPEWNGWAYGTQSQKPALEPIYLGQKPFSEKTGIKNVQKHGVGAVNIDGCRVPTEGEIMHVPQSDPSKRKGIVGSDLGISGADLEAFQAAQRASVEKAQTLGRHPASLILDGSPEVVALFPQENARFFHNFQPDPDPIIYHPKAGKLDRAGSAHPTVKPIALMQYLVRHITPPGGVVLDPFAGSGTTAEAARREGFDCILMEAEPEYVNFLKSRFGLDDHDLIDLLGDAEGPQWRQEKATDPLEELLG